MAMSSEDGAENERTLRALQLIQTVGEREPFAIVPVSYAQGSAMPVTELMAAKVKWAQRAGYTVLPVSVPHRFAPYNAVIRVSERGTEDHMLDYLAHFGKPAPEVPSPGGSLRRMPLSRK